MSALKFWNYSQKFFRVSPSNIKYCRFLSNTHDANEILLYGSKSDIKVDIKLESRKKNTFHSIKTKYNHNRPITMVTAYDYPTSQICDNSGVDIILVGDSVGMVVLGYKDTIEVTMDAMIHHCKAVARGNKYGLMVGDMPFGSYLTTTDALHNATRFIKEGGMDAVKLEGGSRVVQHVKALVDAGIAVVGHVGLTPQSYRTLGGYRVQGRSSEEAQAIMNDATALAAAGACAVVLEMVPSPLAQAITRAIPVPTVGIGAGPHTSGQVLVFHDIVGLYDGRQPKFSKRYADTRSVMEEAVKRFCSEVNQRHFPTSHHSFGESCKPIAASTSQDVEVAANNYLHAPAPTKVLVVGGGALGCLFASRLSLNPQVQVTLLTHWKEQAEAISRDGLALDGVTRRNIAVCSSVPDSAKRAADVVLILTKSYGTQEAAAAAKEAVKDSGVVVAIQNGIGHQDILRKELECCPATLAFGITSFAATVPSPGQVTQTGWGTTTLYPSCTPSEGDADRLNAIASLLNQAEMRARVELDQGEASRAVWRKLAVNAVVNPLAALFSVKNGDLLKPPHSRVLDALVREVAVLGAEKCEWTARELGDEVRKVIEATANNTNSMLSDLRRDSHTEFDNINGALMKQSNASKEAPLNLALSSIFSIMRNGVLASPVQVPVHPIPPPPTAMSVCRSIAEMRSLRKAISASESVGFVPTMGALHDGHLSLVRRAKERCDKVVVSIFVNPTQFAPHEDFDKYPSTMERDLKLLADSGLVHAVFAPSPRDMYPSFSVSGGVRDNGQSVFVVPEKIEKLTKEAESRPRFFTGVSTVCTKLFNIVQPTTAFFGQKDAIQAITLKTIVSELNLPLDISVVDTMREADGLAMSSRNMYLSPQERKVSPVVYASLVAGRRAWDEGSRSVARLRRAVLEVLQSKTEVEVAVDYVSIADGGSGVELAPDEQCGPCALVSVAVKIGTTRLIDNILLC